MLILDGGNIKKHTADSDSALRMKQAHECLGLNYLNIQLSCPSLDVYDTRVCRHRIISSFNHNVL